MIKVKILYLKILIFIKKLEKCIKEEELMEKEMEKE